MGDTVIVVNVCRPDLPLQQMQGYVIDIGDPSEAVEHDHATAHILQRVEQRIAGSGITYGAVLLYSVRKGSI
jgi:hypothetical protein